MKYNNGFTLAEIMVVLGVIGVLTCILLPAAFQATPDENVMKFKKAHNTLGTVIRELVNSDTYYKDGDLGTRPNGDALDGTHDGDYEYFCNTFAQIVQTKSVNCSNINIGTHNEQHIDLRTHYFASKNHEGQADRSCKKFAKDIEAEIITTDGTTFYQTNPQYSFGIIWKTANKLDESITDEVTAENSQHVGWTDRLFSSPNGPFIHIDEAGFPALYKIFCIDIDGIPENATQEDCINECPFGYGIRADGKIYVDKRANEWLEKSIQGDN